MSANDLFAGYNLPRFFEVEVCRLVQCNEFEFIPSKNFTWKNISDQNLDNCVNVTDVVKTKLRENNTYISVRI